MKTLVDHLGQYAEYHRDRRNIFSHFIGIPMIVVAVAVLLSRNANVQDAPVEAAALLTALAAVPGRAVPPYVNVYGDGQAGPRIVDFLASVPLTPDLLDKCNAY